MKGEMKFVEQGIYRIRVKGQLDRSWEHWFDEMTITCEEDGSSLLTGYIPDQPALYGLLIKLRDLGISLISLCRMPDSTRLN